MMNPPIDVKKNEIIPWIRSFVNIISAWVKTVIILWTTSTTASKIKYKLS